MVLNSGLGCCGGWHSLGDSREKTPIIGAVVEKDAPGELESGENVILRSSEGSPWPCQTLSRRRSRGGPQDERQKRAILFADISPRQEATLPLRGTLLQAFEMAESGGLQLTQSCGVCHPAAG